MSCSASRSSCYRTTVLLLRNKINDDDDDDEISYGIISSS